VFRCIWTLLLLWFCASAWKIARNIDVGVDVTMHEPGGIR
jgi:hypothetical protein